MATSSKLTPLQELEARRTAGKDKPTRTIPEAEKAIRRNRVVRAKDALARSVGAKGDHVARARATLKTYLQHLDDPKQPDDARFDELVRGALQSTAEEVERPTLLSGPRRRSPTRSLSSPPPEEEVRHAAGARHGLEVEAVEQLVGGGPQSLAATELDRRDGDVHGVDEVGLQELANGGHAAPEAHVLAVGGSAAPAAAPRPVWRRGSGTWCRPA